MKRFATAILLAFAQASWAASYTSVVSGQPKVWTDPATWGGGGVPGNGDTFTIPLGSTVYLPDAAGGTYGRSALAAPSSALTVVTNAGAVTNLPNGTYRVTVTFVDSNGVETGPGTSESATFTVSNSGTTGQCRISNLPSLPSGAVSMNVNLTDTSVPTTLTERRYCAGITTGGTLDLVGAQWGNTASGGAATGGTTAFAAATPQPPQFDGVIAGSLVAGENDGASVPASLTMRGPLSVAATGGRLITKGGAKIFHDATAAVNPTAQRYPITVGNQALVILGGTPAARCSVTSVSGGGNLYFNGSGSQTGQIQATYTDFLRVGDSATNLTLTTPGPSPGGCWFLNCKFDSCGTVRQSDNGGNAVFRFEGNVCTNTAGANPLYVSSSSALTTGVRTIKFNGFDKIVNLVGVQDLTIENNVFGASWSATGSVAWASNKNNFVTWVQSGGTPTVSLVGDVTGVYFYPTGGINPHFITPSVNFTSITLDSCIFEYGGTSTDGDDVNLPAPAAVSTYTIRRTIKLPNAAGASSGTFFSGLGNGNCRVVCEHNTIHGGGGGDSSGGRVGETFASFTGQILSMRGNLYWDTTPRGYVLYDMTASPAVDAVTAANCDYNGKFNATTGTCTVNGVSVDVLGYRGLNVSGVAQPGAHDTEADPRFLDSTRCLRVWGQRRAGKDGTATKAVEALLADPTKVADLLTWVRAGFTPTNKVLSTFADATHAFPGDTLTTDANGNPLRGTLGAVAYAPAANPFYFRQFILGAAPRPVPDNFRPAPPADRRRAGTRVDTNRKANKRAA